MTKYRKKFGDRQLAERVRIESELSAIPPLHPTVRSLLRERFEDNISTMSKLLRHRDISATMIYAKVPDKKKQDAVGRIPDIF